LRHVCGPVAIVAVLAFTASALAGGWRIIGRGAASGDVAAAAASGSARHPHQLAVRVRGHGALTGFAAVACTRSFSMASAATSFRGAGVHLLRLPTPAGNCSVTASVSGSGRVRVQILAR
jgi:hypothetical protein